MQADLIFTRMVCTWPRFESEGFKQSESTIEAGANLAVTWRSKVLVL